MRSSFRTITGTRPHPPPPFIEYPTQNTRIGGEQIGGCIQMRLRLNYGRGPICLSLDDYYRSPRGQILGFCQYPTPPFLPSIRRGGSGSRDF
ncbi:hypothetical protein CDAR_68071 [Caerostris darwini]|uniref:Uncharacterized protein n=1 Tax=Caerostris darwini TaxID=1538125 RepID=A0AAV4VTK7_9ARAC|nr:hypothetical protein CDAR_68071 [Caerostris darwini]